ncbi:class I SAM-dependent methyltransferase [Micromonospora sp. CPCC 206061]|uniref:class I SAM-dependent methyltransferase n=1 Tax=Micromonospora sp. CPCC 206061 TaxID=3122410 RepID=UPI002FF107D1
MTGPGEAAATAFAVRMWRTCLATQELLTIYLGVRLGLYEALAAGGPATAAELAERAGLAPRYAREWLEQQAVAGILIASGGAFDAERRRFALPEAHRVVLTESDHPLSLAALAVLPLGGVARALPDLRAAYRSGAGVPDEVYGEDWLRGHSGANRALYRHSLAGWLRQAMPDLHHRLCAGPSRVADVACGAGWAGIAIAQAYPLARVCGFDLAPDALADARRNAAAAGVADRVTFEVRDCAEPPPGAGFDLVCVFDALHEMAQPVPVLRACREMRTAGGAVLLMDARVAEEFTAPGDEVERFQYATSVLHCLPACLSGPDSAGTGTVLRPAVVRRYALAAGFTEVAEVPVQERFHRLYRLA